MKTSITHFPEQTQRELTILLSLIRKHIPASNMVILYGSYARGDYVSWDEKVEFGVHTSYQSDFDILLVVSISNYKVTENILRFKVTEEYYAALSGIYEHVTPPQFIVENIKYLNDCLEHSRYFFTDLVKDGILLFDDKQYQLSSPRKLDFKEIREIAISEYNNYYPTAVSLLGALNSYFIPLGDYMNASFLLHQISEKFYYAILLVCTNYKPKNHKLTELSAMVKGFSRRLISVFPQSTPFEKESFDLLCQAYIEGRYNSSFKMTTEQLEYLISRVEILRDITRQIYEEKISWYESQISTGSPKYVFPQEPKSKAADDNIAGIKGLRKADKGKKKRKK